MTISQIKYLYNKILKDRWELDLLAGRLVIKYYDDYYISERIEYIKQYVI